MITNHLVFSQKGLKIIDCQLFASNRYFYSLVGVVWAKRHESGWKIKHRAFLPSSLYCYLPVGKNFKPHKERLLQSVNFKNQWKKEYRNLCSLRSPNFVSKKSLNHTPQACVRVSHDSLRYYEVRQMPACLVLNCDGSSAERFDSFCLM